MQQKKKESSSQPSNYIPGRGRGAIGFITRSDIGPAKVDVYVPNETADGPDDYNDAKFDEWNGYSVPLFNMGDYDEEDREADQTYTNVDKKLEERRLGRKRHDVLEKPSIVNQFSDLKREMAKMTADEWLSIPEIGDYSIKKKKEQKFTPISDSVIMSAHNQNQSMQSKVQDLNEIGEARGTLLSLKLDKMSGNVAGQSQVDTRGYLTSLASLPKFTETEIGDFKKARLLLKSVILTDPKNSFGWIAAARIEELDGKMQAARSILAQAIQQAEDQEDIWIEVWSYDYSQLARLETPDKAKQILSKAVQTLPHSVKLWLTAAHKEIEKADKCKVLKRALEFISNSVDIWKELIGLSDEQEALILLHRAVECIPKNLSIWLALAKLETYDNAKAVLNKARQCLPQESTIWIHAAKLEESAGKDKYTIAMVLSNGIRILKKNGVKIVREDWLLEAELAEKSQNYQTCYAIIRAIYSSCEELDNIWYQDICTYESNGSIHTARAIISYVAEIKSNEVIYSQYLEFETRHSKKYKPTTMEISQYSQEYWHYDVVLQEALKAQPLVEQFWIDSIVRKHEIGQDYEQLVEQAPKSESLLILASKLELSQATNEHIEKAKQYLQQATVVGTSRSWIKLIKLQMLLQEDITIAEAAVLKYQKSDKLWILLAKTQIRQNKIDEARKTFETALGQHLSTSVQLWLNYIQMECNLGLFPKARPLIDRAKAKLPKNAQIWISAVRLEIDAGSKKAAIFTLNKALQECPRTGELWSLAIELEPKNTAKKKSADAVTLCADDPYVYVSTAKIFLKEAKVDKAKKWLEKALILEPRLGDAWAYLYMVDKNILGKCMEIKPKFGRLWKRAKEMVNSRFNYESILIQATKLAQLDIAKIE